MTTPSLAPEPELHEYGDSAVMITVRSADADLRRRRIVEIRDGFVAHRPHGVTDLVSGLESLLVEYDPLLTAPADLRHTLRRLAGSAGTSAPPLRRVFDLPVVFDAQTGPDLDAVAAELELSADEVVAKLTSHELTIVLLAAAMAPMMSGVRLPAPVARQSQPRTNVPAGSIMIAGANAIIQPFPGPTGWRVVGRTPLTIVDITRDPPVSFAPGDVVRLRAVSSADAATIDGFLREERHG
jgi:KipI family sensor histidine kinase inhibitor